MICKNVISGIKDIFIVPFIEFPRRFFIDGGLEISTQVKITPVILSFSSFSGSFDDGVFSQTLRFKTSGLINNDLVEELKNYQFRAVITDNNKNNYVIGQENGLDVKVTFNSGSNKGDFSGFDFTLEGKEKEEYIKINNLNQFIEGATLFLSSSDELSSSSSLISNIYNG